MKDVGENEQQLIVRGDLNADVRAEADRFEGVHGGKGLGIRNVDGEMWLEFTYAMGLAACNSGFIKTDSQKVTYESGGFKT